MCLQKKKKKEPGREEAKFALYGRKHSNLLLITTGPSSSGTSRQRRQLRNKVLPFLRPANKPARNMRIYLQRATSLCSENTYTIPLFTQKWPFIVHLHMPESEKPSLQCPPKRWDTAGRSRHRNITSLKTRYIIDLFHRCWSHRRHS